MDELLNTIQFDNSNAPHIFKPGQYVVMRIEMDTEDTFTIQNHMAKMSGVKQGQKSAEITMTLGDSTKATLQRMLVGWGGITRKVADPSGNIKEMPLLYDPANVGKLPKKVSDFVLQKINEFNPDPDEEEIEAFLPGSNGRTGEHSEKVRALHPSS